MPIELITGLPGTGKTAMLVERIMMEGAKKNARPLVAMGINGLQPGLCEVLDDPKKWSEITDREQGPCRCPLIGGDMVNGEFPPHTHRIPHGALIFVDEAWKWFGHLHDASRQATPRHVLDLAEHRHMGVDFVWTSQGPNQIYPFARALVQAHTHAVRRFGTQFIDLFKWEELNEDVKSVSKRENAQRTTRTIPKESFGRYTSAQEHTIKASVPWKVWALPFILLAAILCGWLAYAKLKSFSSAGQGTEAGADGLPAAPPSASGVASNRAERGEPETAAEYAARHMPRFATMPHTAPVFDDRSVTADPLLICTSTDGGYTAQDEYRGPECQCMSEQGTRYQISDAQCREVARWGQPYNPYRARSEAAESQPVQTVQPQPVAAARAPVGMGEAGFPARYGQFRNESPGPRNYEAAGW